MRHSSVLCFCSLMLVYPGIARADALDAAWFVAAAVGAVWLLVVLVAVSAAFGFARSGSLGLTAFGILGVWIALSPPALIALTENWSRADGGFFWGMIAQWFLGPIVVASVLTSLILRASRAARQPQKP